MVKEKVEARIREIQVVVSFPGLSEGSRAPSVFKGCLLFQFKVAQIGSSCQQSKRHNESSNYMLDILPRTLRTVSVLICTVM